MHTATSWEEFERAYEAGFDDDTRVLQDVSDISVAGYDPSALPPSVRRPFRDSGASAVRLAAVRARSGYGRPARWR